jgi:hypothetical protein
MNVATSGNSLWEGPQPDPIRDVIYFMSRLVLKVASVIVKVALCVIGILVGMVLLNWIIQGKDKEPKKEKSIAR